jgi:DNA-binding beta-propeller fold protein YncE
VISRRTCLAAGLASVLSACRKQRGDGFAGYAFVANEEGHAIAAVDLTAFAVARHIRLTGAPRAVIAHPSRPVVFALTPDTGTLHEIDAGTLSKARSLRLGGPVWSMRPESDGGIIWVLSREGRSLQRVDTSRFEVTDRLRLPADPIDFDLQASYQDGSWAGFGAVSHGDAGSISIVDLAKGTVKGPLAVGGEAGLVRFRSDGKSILVANRSERMLTVIDPATGRIVVHLPLSLRPDEFCFHPDGGQLFISGEGRDAVAIVYPYFVPEVAETVLAGSRPGPMAASSTHLFVTNPAAGDVTILDIVSKKVMAVAAVGADPGYVTVTPDREYALVLNRKSGDMAVIRIAGLQPDRRKSAALFTMIPVGSKPVSAVVTPV